MRNRTGVGVVLCVLAFGASAGAYTAPIVKSPTGKAVPKNNDARNAIRHAFSSCTDSMRDKPNPANATEAKYQEYIQWRGWIDKLEPGDTAYDASIDYVTDMTPSKFIPKCDKYFGDYAAGVGAADLPLSPDCEGRIKPFVKLANDFAKNGSKVGDIRMNVEHVRLALYGKYDMGFVVPRCDTNDKFKKAFAPIKAQYDALEAMVTPLETAKGLKFIQMVETLPSPLAGVSSLTIVHYVDLKTNQPVEPFSGRF
jgi:hypothetical protein